eukprot:scaffold55586_cov58-Phaeocystis_antarctica.AAC.1
MKWSRPPMRVGHGRLPASGWPKPTPKKRPPKPTVPTALTASTTTARLSKRPRGRLRRSHAPGSTAAPTR